MSETHPKLIVSLILLVMGFFLSLAIAGLPAAIIFSLLWFEKVTLGLTQGMLAELGIEFATVPLIFIGILYGPATAFIVGFFGMPILDSLRWFISPPKYSGGWLPIVPGPDSFVDGLTGSIAGLLASFSFSIAAPLAVIARNVIKPVEEAMAYGKPPSPSLLINAAFNLFLVNVLSFVIQL